MKKSLIDHCYLIAKRYNPKHCQWDCDKHYSFIIQNNQIVEWGTNKSGNPNRAMYKDYQKIHSEYSAWAKAKGIIDKSKSFELLNLRLNKSGKLMLSKPCNCCLGFLKGLNCSKIIFSTEMGFAKLI